MCLQAVRLRLALKTVSEESHPVQKPKGIDVSIRDIAAVVGCSRSTVSRVLRGETYVKDELRAKVAKVAKEMGYRPNPLVVSLMSSQNSRRGRKRLSANMAWLNAHPNKNFWRDYPHFRRFYSAAKQRALEVGYGFDEIWLREEGLTGERLDQILQARSIHGLLVSGTMDIFTMIEFDSSKYAVAAIGVESLGHLDWNRAGLSLRHNLETAFNKLREMKYRRIAFAVPVRNVCDQNIELFNKQSPGAASTILDEAQRGELSGYLFCLSDIPLEDRMSAFVYNRDKEDSFIDGLAKWIDEVSPDAIICSDRCVLEAAEKSGRRVPDDLAIAHLRIADDVSDWAGMDIHAEEQAEAAVDILSSSIQFNRRGVVSRSCHIYIKGEWRDGWTAPSR